MMKMNRYAIYYAPPEGAFADAAAQWLGWDLAHGRALPPAGVLGGQDITQTPRKYGFHATIKPPFRLADGVDLAQLDAATAGLAAGLPKVILPALELVTLEGFLALIPAAPSADLQDLAAEVVRALDPYRAPLSPAEIARRRPEMLTTRQRELLGIYGYPYVMEQFQFHLTLSGALAADQTAQAMAAAQSHFAGVVPQPFVIADLCLCGEDDLGQFHLMHRYPLMA